MSSSESGWSPDQKTLTEAMGELQELKERFSETSWEHHVLQSSLDKIKSVIFGYSPGSNSENDSIS